MSRLQLRIQAEYRGTKLGMLLTCVVLLPVMFKVAVESPALAATLAISMATRAHGSFSQRRSSLSKIEGMEILRVVPEHNGLGSYVRFAPGIVSYMSDRESLGCRLYGRSCSELAYVAIELIPGLEDVQDESYDGIRVMLSKVIPEESDFAQVWSVLCDGRG